MGISACLIVKNEEKWIEGCLQHLKSLVDEIIVVDTGSSDRTEDLARANGARVSSFRWTGDFAKARNASLEKATQDWILIIDPDERLSEQDLPKIKALCERKEVMGFSFPTRNYTQNHLASGFRPCAGNYADLEKNYSGYFESRKVRLFQNLPTHRFQGSVHELVEASLQGQIEESEIPFHHYGATQEEVERKEKRQFYREQTQKKIKEQPQDWKAQFEMGIECLTGGDFSGAVKALEAAKKLKPDESLVLSNLGYAYMEAGRLKEAEEVLKTCISLDPKNHDGHLNLGVTKMRAKEYDKAIEIFEKLLKIHPGSFMAFRNAGNCYAKKKELNKAARCFEWALKLFPQFHEARLDLSVVCLAGGRHDLAEQLLQEVRAAQPESPRAQALAEQIQKAKSQASSSA